MSLYDSILSRIFTKSLQNSVVTKDLLDSEEVDIINAYFQLSRDARFLFVRLYIRQDNWLRESSLNYDDVQNISNAVKELKRQQYLICNNVEDGLLCTLNLLSADEVKCLAKKHSITTTKSNKEKILEKILEKCKTQRTIFGRLSDIIKRDCLNILGPVVRVNMIVRKLIDRCLVIYLCPSVWEEVSLVNDILTVTDKRKFHQYVIRPTSVFSTRDQVVQYEYALQLEEKVFKLCEEKRWEEVYDIFQEVFVNWDSRIDASIEEQFGKGLCAHFTDMHVYTRMISQFSLALARLHRFEEEFHILNRALSQPVFCVRSRARWWKRLVLVMEKLSGGSSSAEKELQAQKVVDKCQEALGDPYLVGGHKRAVANRMKRLLKRLKSKILENDGFEDVLQSIPSVKIHGLKGSARITGKKSKWIDDFDDSDSLTVEQVALDHYLKQGWFGVHAENSVLTTVFALLFWDIIFADVEEAFIHPFQVAPLDLSTEFFHQKRKEIITERLEVIKSIEYACSLLEETYTKYGKEQTLCVGVNWAFEIDFLKVILQMVGDKLPALMNIFCVDYRGAKSGFPDLTLWKEDGVKFVEVKGPGDSLMEHQEIWLDRLFNLQLPVEICYVVNEL